MLCISGCLISGPVAVTSGGVAVANILCWDELETHRLSCTVCGAKSAKACGEARGAGLWWGEFNQAKRYQEKPGVATLHLLQRSLQGWAGTEGGSDARGRTSPVGEKAPSLGAPSGSPGPGCLDLMCQQMTGVWKVSPCGSRVLRL